MGNRSEKSSLRRAIRRVRRASPEKDEKSDRIALAVLAMPWVAEASLIMAYVDTGSEVRTCPLIRRLLADGKQVAVPYCQEKMIRPWLCCGLDELVPGTLGILEPPEELRGARDRQVVPETIDVILVPGVVFDRAGRRIGQGGGYYDRFLASLAQAQRPMTIGLAFECQLVDRVPTDEKDMPVDVLVTEAGMYR